MQEKSALNYFEIEPDFDPLFEGEAVAVDPETIDLNGADDIVEMPMLPNMPEGVITQGAYDPANYDDPKDAIRALFERNPGRKPIYLGIIEMCEKGNTSTAITKAVDEMQRDNRSVYAPMTLCRALERAGAIQVDIPESSEGVESQDGVSYLVIKEEVDPVWTSTEEGCAVLNEEQAGRAFKELFIADSNYLFMYKAVLCFVSEQPRTKKEIDQLVDNDPRVQEPRRYSNHFIELLEKADAFTWKNNTWNITDLGHEALEALASVES